MPLPKTVAVLALSFLSACTSLEEAHVRSGVVEPPASDTLLQLEAAGQWLEEHSPWQNAACVPWKWHPIHSEVLAREVAEVLPFVERVHMLSARPEFRSPQLWRTVLGTRNPRLGKTRNQVNVLCGAAVLAAREGANDRAHELLHAANAIGVLLRDGSEIGDGIRQMSSGIVLQAIASLAYESDPGPCTHCGLVAVAP